MANTYYTIYLHTVFAVKYREALIPVGLQVADHIHFLWSMSLKPKAVFDEYDRLLRLNRVVNLQYKFMPLI